jgi:hypothetical protein
MSNQDLAQVERARSHLDQADRELRALFQRHPELREIYKGTLAALAHIRDAQHDAFFRDCAHVFSMDDLRNDVALKRSTGSNTYPPIVP